jgi:hypothetical protein
MGYSFLWKCRTRQHNRRGANNEKSTDNSAVCTHRIACVVSFAGKGAIQPNCEQQIAGQDAPGPVYQEKRRRGSCTDSQIQEVGKGQQIETAELNQATSRKVGKIRGGTFF